MYDDAGLLVGKVAAVGDYKRAEDTLQYRIKMRSDMQLPEPLTGIVHYNYNLLPNGPGKAVVLSHFRVRGESGTIYKGFTSIPYGYDSDTVLARPVAGVQMIDTTLDGLNFTYRTLTHRRFAPYETEEIRDYYDEAQL